MKIKSLLTYLILLCFGINTSTAENKQHIYHYTTENGLPQYTIMDMFQGKKGFMWFATWDGISKFDGYSFHNYKIQPGDNYSMKSNRIEKFAQDKYERIWMISYEGDFHCFNPATESFWGFQLVPELKNFKFFTTDIKVLPSGRVWITSESDGCVLIADSLFSMQRFNTSNNTMRSNFVRTVFEDKNKNSWILTENGLYQLPCDKTNLIDFQFPGKVKNQSFYAVCQSKNLWFGSSKGMLWEYDSNNKSFNSTRLSFDSEIIAIAPVRGNKLIVLSASNGFALFDPQTLKAEYFNVYTHPQLKTNIMKSVVVDHAGRIWIDISHAGVCKFDENKKTIKYYFVPANDVSTSVFSPKFILINDRYGNTWVQPKGCGLTRYNPDTDELESFDTSVGSDVKMSNVLRSACADKQGNLWLCTRSQGLEKVSFDKSYFKIRTINPKSGNTLSNTVRMVYEDKDHNLWISTKDQRVTILDADKHIIGRLATDGSIRPDAFFSSAVYTMLQDNGGNIWLGTKNNGLFLLKRKMGKMNFEIEHFKRNDDDPYSVSENSIYSTYQDKRGNIWIGTYGGGLNLVRNTPEGKIKFISSRNELKKYPAEMGKKVRFITQDNHNHICIGTTEGLIIFPFQFYSTSEIEFRTYSRIPGNEHSLSNNDVHNILITRNGEMYIATFGGGINKVISRDKDGYPVNFIQYNANNGMPSDVTLAMREDDENTLWISTEKDLTRFDPEKNSFETFTEINRLMNTATFSEATAFKTHNGEFIFGYSDGIISFNPADITHDDFKPYIALSGFQIFNKNVPIGKKSPLTSAIDYVDKLVLTHKQNFFTVSFAALDMTEANRILYAYKLEGFDNDWNYIQKQRVANYTNLPHGEYILHVRSTNSEGLWMNNERSLPIEILPSFWETPVAYLLYVISVLAVGFLIFYILITIYHLKANVKFEKQMSEMKLRFFTDISHEIRTPLTMITAPLENILNDTETPDKIRKQLKVISQNTSRLLRLVNQILDFRKMQFMKIRVMETDIAKAVKQIYENFSEIAKAQHITYQFINESTDSLIWVDADCLEKIVMNLLSNAFKYTPQEKTISVIIKSDDKTVSVIVCDQGPGMNKEKQRRLFTRFASFNEDKDKPSTGIGLSMVRDLAEKHGARVIVDSEVNRGSCFTVTFLRGINHFNKKVEIISGTQPATVSASVNIQQEFVQNESTVSEKHTSHKHADTILVVEDDNDLRKFMRSVLEKEYNVLEAIDGQEGVEKAREYIPDFVVSDIMMPRMDGIELLKDLKTCKDTSHIPIVLLTAKTTIESKLEGLGYGADDYITKPFSVTYFMARIANLLEQRRHLQEHYRNMISGTVNEEPSYEPQPFVIASHDEEMMKKLVAIIEENMAKPDFVVENIGQELSMSRSVFFRKLKSLTGLSPIEFIRDIRMKRAAQLLASGEYRVKEAAAMVGISDTKYFGKCFKAKYGITPQEYKNKND